MAGFICKIVIENTHPPVWRRILLPEGITFEDLHEIIQTVFGWKNEHLHNFETPDRERIISSEDEGSEIGYPESKTGIDPFFRKYKWIRYTYDFGDEWRHKIHIEKLDEDYKEPTAMLLKAKGDNFAENSGGVWNLNRGNRTAFDQEGTEKQLRKMMFSTMENSPERLRKFDERLSRLIVMYGMIETEALYEIYSYLYGKGMEKQEFFRLLYGHAGANHFIQMVYQENGICYAASTQLDPERIIEKMNRFGKELSYVTYKAKEIEWAASDLANRSECVDTLYTTLKYGGKLSETDAQDWIEKCVSMILSGYNLNQIVEAMEAEIKGIRSLEVAAEIWTETAGLMLELELPFLKGRSRIRYAQEQGCSPWSVDMTEEPVGEAKTWKRMYQFPAEVQEWMYDAFEYGMEDSFRKLLDYKKQNPVISEEYLYLFAYSFITYGEQDLAEDVIRELRGVSKTGKHAAKFLDERIKTWYELDDEEAEDRNGETWEEIDWLERINLDAQTPKTYVRMEPKIGRNDPCPCGSGKKYKKCCGKG